MNDENQINNPCDYNSYKYEACRITGEECNGNDCNHCEIAYNELERRQTEDKDNEINEYTVFERKSEFHGLSLLANSVNIIGKMDLMTGRAVIKYYSLNPLSYCPDYLKQYAVHLRKLRQYNKLGIPDEIFGKKNHLAAFRWGDVWYLIAPRIESE